MNRNEIKEYLISKKAFREDGNLNTAFLRHLDETTLSIINSYEGSTPQEKIWNIFNDRPSCAICGKPTEFINYSKGYKKTCSKECFSKHRGIKARETWKNLDKEAIQRKREETNIKKYGVKNPGMNKDIQEKMKSTCKERYGSEYFFATELSQERIKATNREKYGCDYGLSNPEVIEKRRQTLRSKYGVENSKQIPGLIEKQYKEFEERLYKGETPFTLQECELAEPYKGQWSGPNKQLPFRKYTFRCKKCGNKFERIFDWTWPVIRCPDCFKSHNRSYWEVEICDWLSSSIEIEKTNRSILGGKELDIYIPSKKIAIECDGVYFHSEKFVDKNYHLSKTLECEKQGIRLIHIFEDEWMNRKEIVKSIIKSALGIYDNKIGARQCEIVEGKCEDFFNTSHLQGSTRGKYCYQLKYNNETVAALLIGKPRFNKDYDYEILRFAVKLNTEVFGAFSKLFNYFRKDHPGKIITYSDRRLFTGNLYRKLFNELTPSDPGYSYSNNVDRIPRYEMTKKKLSERYPEDSNLPESMIANKHGYYKIYDCGQFRFESTT